MNKKAIVVGAGINGLLLTKELLGRGWSVTVCDAGPIPNPNSASYGRHRLIHPWNHPSSKVAPQSASEALIYWEAVLSDIQFRSFCKTGVAVVNKTEENSNHSLNCDSNAIELSHQKAVDLMPQLKGGDFFNLTLYPKFGCLLADQILQQLVLFLAKDDRVCFRPNFKISWIDTHLTSVTGSDGEIVYGDRIFVVAGAGTSLLATQVGVNLPATSMRCYVLYIKGKGNEPCKFGTPCWASLGLEHDLWGMPSVRGIPAKLGCGTITHQCEIDAPLMRQNDIVEKIVKTYSDSYPQFFSGNELFELRFNHWTMFNFVEQFHVVQNVIFTAICSGVGFKFAPAVVKNICDRL